MNDYMTALLERFGVGTPELAEDKAAVRAAEETLRATLDGDRRRLLLRLADQHNRLLQEAALCGFLSGWRAASGIRDELEALPRFSIIAEDEARAIEYHETKEL